MRVVSISLALFVALPPVAAIVCPPQSVATAPAQQLEGDVCGGMCDSYGTCAEGLVCRPPPRAAASSWQSLRGVIATGTCTREDAWTLAAPTGGPPNDSPNGSPDSSPGTRDEELEIIVAGVQQLNDWVSSMYLIVPVSTVSFEQRRDEHGLGYSINVHTQTSSACRNDGQHKVDDVSCPPDSEAKLQLYHLEVADQGENSRMRYMLVDVGVGASPNSSPGTRDEEREIVVAGVQQLNDWLNSMYLIVPVSTVSFEQRRDEHGLGYSINVNTRTSSACRNDGQHKVDDVSCPPDSDAKLQLYHLEVADQGENSRMRYMLVDVQDVVVGASPDSSPGTRDEEREIVVAGVQQLNDWLNSMYLIVPVSTVSFEQRRNEHGLSYSIIVNTRTSSVCRNDGQHKVDDVSCPPDSDAKSQLYHLEIADQGENSQMRYMLVDAEPWSEHIDSLAV